MSVIAEPKSFACSVLSVPASQFCTLVRPLFCNANCRTVHDRGSKFLKRWMDFLESNADLRYPNVSDVLGSQAAD